MRVLIVEDDAALGLFLAKGLKLEGHDVDLAVDGQDGLRHALDHRPDLMVLDLCLPKMDGMRVLEEMHGRFANTSVLVLTGRTSVEERVRCLNLGADDFLLKPFSFSELTARCKVLLRRRMQYADPVLRMGDVELNRIGADGEPRRAGGGVDRQGVRFAGVPDAGSGTDLPSLRLASRCLAHIPVGGDECGRCLRELSAQEAECGSVGSLRRGCGGARDRDRSGHRIQDVGSEYPGTASCGRIADIPI